MLMSYENFTKHITVSATEHFCVCVFCCCCSILKKTIEPCVTFFLRGIFFFKVENRWQSENPPLNVKIMKIQGTLERLAARIQLPGKEKKHSLNGQMKTDRQEGQKWTNVSAGRVFQCKHEELTAVLFVTPVSALCTAVATIDIGDTATISTLKLCLFITGGCGQNRVMWMKTGYHGIAVVTRLVAW